MTSLLVATLVSCTDTEPSADAPPTPGVTATAAEATPAEPSPSEQPPTGAGEPPPAPDPGEPPPPGPGCVRTVLQGLSLTERAGQLLMVGVPADASEPDAVVTQAVRELGAGAVILTGRSDRSVQETRALVDQLAALVPAGAEGRIGLEVAVDQEGGQVQVLQGPGFATIPTATVQGGWPDARLQRWSSRWARQLRAAGVTLNLSPVADVVPPGRVNAPIGQFDREFAGTPGPAAAKVGAFVRGSLSAGVGTTVKHFPGLGRASGNTDDTADVVDDLTRRGDALLAPFRAGIADRTPYVMMSTARYTRLDPDTVAAFSSFVVGTMLREDLGFDGVVISDDVGVATSLQSVVVGQRAVRFLAAGGDVVLTVVAAQAPEMLRAILEQARQSAGFRAQVDEAVLRVLRRKAAMGALECPPAR